jgi:hypothetical protein
MFSSFLLFFSFLLKKKREGRTKEEKKKNRGLVKDHEREISLFRFSVVIIFLLLVVCQLNDDLNFQMLRNGLFNVSKTNPSRR